MTRKNPAMLHIGAQKEAIDSARAAIMDILNCTRAGDPAKVSAFDALKTLCAVTNVSVTNCTFNATPKAR